MKRYFFITDPRRENPNPGDIFIGKGIEYLIRESEDEQIIANYLNIFNPEESHWERAYLEADAIILCGTPNFNKDGKSHIFNLLPFIEKAKCRKVALWVGSGFSSDKYTEEQAISRLYKTNKHWLEEYGRIFNLIVVRDNITKKLFDKVNVKTTQLCDSVFFASDYYEVVNKNPEYNLIVLRDLHNLNKDIVSSMEKVERTLNNKFPIYWLCHSVTDFLAYKDIVRKEKLICVNNPSDLLEMYSRANQVVTLRIHGAVPSANFGKEVVNIRIDSRDNILEYFGCKSITLSNFLDNVKLEFHTYDVKNMKLKDKARFKNLWRKV